MRLLDLRLEKFGPFTDFKLELNNTGVQIIYGPNEAGKSSILRAVTHFLYGFPSRTLDDHVHSQSSLRVGAKVQSGDAKDSPANTITLYRKKGNKNTLLDASFKVVEDTLLVNLLNNLPKAQFITFFGLNHKALVAGGEDLIKGQGNLGEALFSASIGGQQFQQLLKQLDARKGELFKSGGSKPKLNVAFKKLVEAEKQHKALCLKSSDWEKAQADVEDSSKALDAVQLAYKKAFLEKERLQRIKRTLPNLSTRTGIIEKLADLDAVRTLPINSAQTRLNAITDINRCQPAIKQLKDTIQSSDNHLQSISLNHLVLAQEVAINALKDERGLYQKNNVDYQLLQGEVTQRKNDIDAIVAGILPVNSTKRLDELRLTIVVRQTLGSLVDEGLEIEAALLDINKKIQESDEQIAEAEGMLIALPQSDAMDDLQLAIKDAERALTTEQEIKQLKQQLRELEAAGSNQVCQLGLTAMSESKLLALPVPSNIKIGEMKVANEKLMEEKEREGKRLYALNVEIAALKTRQKEANVRGQQITEDDLNATRQKRESLWAAIKAAWKGQTDTTVVINKELKANEYETQVLKADQYADRLRREADRLAEYGQTQIQLEKLTSDSTDLQKKLAIIHSDLDASAQAWQALWSAELEPVGSCVEMIDWEFKFRQLQTSVNEKAKLNSIIKDKSPFIEQSSHYLEKVLQQSGKSNGTKKSLALLVEQANSVLTQLLQAKEARQSHETRWLDAKKQKSKRCKALEQTRQEKADWLQRCNRHIAVLEIPKDSTVNEVKAQLNQFDKLQEAQNQHRKIEANRVSLYLQIKCFKETATQLKDQCGLPDQGEVEPLNQLRELVAELKTALEDKNKIQTITTDIQRHQETLDSETLRLKKAQEALDGLYLLAGCKKSEQLEQIEAQNREKEELKKDLARIDVTLAAESFTIDALMTESEGVNVDELPLMIEKVMAELGSLEQNKKQAIEDRANASSASDAIENQAGAVNAAEDAESALAQIDIYYREYCMLALTRQLLNEQIESYRLTNQGPVLSLAEAYFQRISLGRYSRLVTQYNDQDEPELYCLRGDSEVAIAGLSEGTRDQLFFSLRLASIVHYFENHATIPLIIDDIMVTFDDERSLVAFEILGELARKTQVLYFTHHSHHKDLAKKALNHHCVFQDLTPLAVA